MERVLLAGFLRVDAPVWRRDDEQTTGPQHASHLCKESLVGLKVFYRLERNHHVDRAVGNGESKGVTPPERHALA